MNLWDKVNPIEAKIEQEMDKPRRTMTANGAWQWCHEALQGEKRSMQGVERSVTVAERRGGA
jgi:SH3-like domain-containing protein